MRLIPEAIRSGKSLDERLEGAGLGEWAGRVDTAGRVLGAVAARLGLVRPLEGWIDFEAESADYHVGVERRIVRLGRVWDDDDEGDPIPGSERAEVSPFDVMSVASATVEAELAGREPVLGVDCDYHRGVARRSASSDGQMIDALNRMRSASESIGVEAWLDDMERLRRARLTVSGGIERRPIRSCVSGRDVVSDQKLSATSSGGAR